MAKKTIKKTEDESTIKRTEKGRDAKGRFTKGYAGGGRPKMPEEIKQAFRELLPTCVEKLTEIINSEETRPEVKVKAIEVIMDRGLGKPTQAIDLEAKSLPRVVFTSEDNLLE